MAVGKLIASIDAKTKVDNEAKWTGLAERQRKRESFEQGDANGDGNALLAAEFNGLRKGEDMPDVVERLDADGNDIVIQEDFGSAAAIAEKDMEACSNVQSIGQEAEAAAVAKKKKKASSGPKDLSPRQRGLSKKTQSIAQLFRVAEGAAMSASLRKAEHWFVRFSSPCADCEVVLMPYSLSLSLLCVCVCVLSCIATSPGPRVALQR